MRSLNQQPLGIFGQRKNCPLSDCHDSITVRYTGCCGETVHFLALTGRRGERCFVDELFHRGWRDRRTKRETTGQGMVGDPGYSQSGACSQQRGCSPRGKPRTTGTKGYIVHRRSLARSRVRS